MRKVIYLAVVLITLMVMTIVVIAHRYNAESEDSIFFVVLKNGNEYRINYWYDEINELFYVFLPSFAELENVVVRANGNYVYIENNKYSGRRSKLSDIQLNTKKAFLIQNENEELVVEGTIIFMQSANIATMFINTDTGTLEHIHYCQSHREGASMRLVTASGVQEYAGRLVHIGGRGNTSWLEGDKNGYSVRLAHEADLLGMGTAINWVLVPNHLDRAYIRQKIGNQFSREIGLRFANYSKLIDLYINNEFKGLYLLSERIEIAPNRIEITESNSSDITGGYILELDVPWFWIEEEFGFVTSREQHMSIRRPTRLIQAQVDFIANRWQALEDAIFDHDDKERYKEYLDITSWAMKYIIEELVGSYDANNSSQYFYKDSDRIDPLFYAGPIWDHNATLGNHIYILVILDTL